MGVGRRLIQRRHKLRDDVQDNIPKQGKANKKDEILNDSPGAYGTIRGMRRRMENDLGRDFFKKKQEAAWQAEVTIDRFDFDPGAPVDNGIRITFSETIQQLARGARAGDEIRVLEEGSALELQRFEMVEEANSGDVAAGKCRIVDDTTLRLPDDAAFVTESNVEVRIELAAGARL